MYTDGVEEGVVVEGVEFAGGCAEDDVILVEPVLVLIVHIGTIDVINYTTIIS